MRPFDSKRVLLGVTGGIASYKSVWLARHLTQWGATVDVVMTRAAAEFVGAITFEAVTGRPVFSELLAAGHALDHIRLVRDASAIVVAPATADFLARAAHGHAGDLLTACLLAAGPSQAAAAPPVLLVPAMNDRMWAHAATQRNAGALRALGYHVLEPEDGPLAAGEGSGPGRMPEPETIAAHLGRLLEPAGALRSRRIVVTAGPTREALDPVRFLSNRSSGKMGVALAAAAWRRGADVTLIAGPLGVDIPAGVRHVAIETTSGMAAAVERVIGEADVLIMAAAPADFRADVPAASKIKKAGAAPTLALASTPDILLTTRRARREGMVVVGFSLETGDAVPAGRAKLESKGLDLIVVNDATETGAGFEVDTNRVTLLSVTGADEILPLMPKVELADVILDRVEALLRGR